MKIHPFSTTAIGSIGCKDVGRAIELYKKYLDIPTWPQLPKKNFRENMYVQFSEALPGVEIFEEEGEIFINNEISDEVVLSFYENFLNKNYDYFQISASFASGFHEFLQSLRQNKTRIVKGQVTGPVSFGLTLNFIKGGAIFYDQKWRDIVVKHLTMKAKWQINLLKENASLVIMFIDEPYLTLIGSGFVNIPQSALITSLSEMVSLLKEDEVLIGIHCCGNTDWNILATIDFDIISFDSYNYAQSLLIYPDLVRKFLQEGRYIAWGIVPSSPQVLEIEISNLKERIDEMFFQLEKKGVSVSLMKEHAILTPSCGMGSLEEELGVKVLEVLSELKQFLR